MALRIIEQLTEAEWFRDVMAFLEGEKVPIAAWLSRRNPGLAISKYLARVLSVWDAFLVELEDSLFLQSATGNGLTKFGRSQYQLEPFPEQTQLARFVLFNAAGSPQHAVAAGDVVVTLRGGSQEWVNTEDVTIDSDRKAVVILEAREAGTSYNVPTDSAIELVTTLSGVTVENPATGQATAVGLNASGLYLYANDSGVTVEVIDPGALSQPLTVTGNLMSKLVTISLATDGAGALISTADEVREAIVTAVSATGVPQLVFWAKNQTTGAGVMTTTSSPVALKWNNSYIERAGASVEDPQSYQRRCFVRFMALGGWAGDGAPPAPVATDEGLEFWARNPRPGESRSPVVGVKVLSNFLSGSPSGKDITVLVWGTAGALTADEVAAVDANFYNGRKFSTGSDMHTLTVINTLTGLGGTVYVSLASGYTEDQVRAAIATRIALYQSKTDAVYPGMILEPSILSARIADALPDGAITKVDLTVPSLPTTFSWQQFPMLDPSPLVISFV